MLFFNLDIWVFCQDFFVFLSINETNKMQIIKATILKMTYGKVSPIIWAGLVIAAMFSQMSCNICRSASMYRNPLGRPVKIYFQLSQIHVMDSVKSVCYTPSM